MYTTSLKCSNCKSEILAFRDKKTHKAFSKVICQCGNEMECDDLPYYKIIPAHELDRSVKNSVAHIMTDIETLSAPNKGRFNCQILSIALVPMGVLTGVPSCYIKINPTPDERFFQDEKTKIWWGEQNKDVKDEAFSGSLSQEEAADVFIAYWKMCENKINELNDERLAQNLRPYSMDIGLWGNGNDFDNNIIMSWLEILNRPVPWKYWNSHSMRTALFLNPQIKRVFPSANTGHNALVDAKCQAKSINALL